MRPVLAALVLGLATPAIAQRHAAPHLSATRFDRMVQRAAQGDRDALRAIASMRGHADAARAEGIDKALSDALTTRPATVLALLRADPAMPAPEWVCQDRAIEPVRAQADRFTRRAVAAVAAVRDPALRADRDRCLTALRHR